MDIPDAETLEKLDIAIYLTIVVVKRDDRWYHRSSGEEINPAFYTTEFEVQEWEYYDHNTKLVPESNMDWTKIPFIIVDTETNCIADASIETGEMFLIDGLWNVRKRGEEYTEGQYKIFFEKDYFKER